MINTSGYIQEVNPPMPIKTKLYIIDENGEYKEIGLVDWLWPEIKLSPVIFNPPYPYKSYIGQYPNDVCLKCSNHPNNGGTGFCSCTLPYISSVSYNESTQGVIDNTQTN